MSKDVIANQRAAFIGNTALYSTAQHSFTAREAQEIARRTAAMRFRDEFNTEVPVDEAAQRAADDARRAREANERRWDEMTQADIDALSAAEEKRSRRRQRA